MKTNQITEKNISLREIISSTEDKVMKPHKKNNMSYTSVINRAEHCLVAVADKSSLQSIEINSSIFFIFNLREYIFL